MLLDILHDGPRHGYEIIKAFEEHTHGQYAPSPGTVYPTLQYLEELGLVRADQEADRRVYHLTEAGRGELEAHSDEVREFWSHFAETPASLAGRQETGFLRDALEDLNRTVWRGLHSAADGNAIACDNPALIRRLRLAVEGCQNEVRRLLTEPADDEKSAA